MEAFIEGLIFKRLIDNTKRFIRKETHYTDKRMSYIYLEVDAPALEIRASAVDGHRVSIEHAKLISANWSFKCYIKPNIPKVTKYDTVKLELIGGRLLITVGDNIVGYIQPDCGNFYEVDKIVADTIKEEEKASVYVDAKLLKEALDSVSNDSATKKPVKIEIRGKKSPIVIRSGEVNGKENIKLVLPVNRGE